MSINLKIAIAEVSAIVRSGMEAQLKKIGGFRFQFIEIHRPELIPDSLRMQKPDVLIVNPVMAAGLSLSQLRDDSGCTNLKCIALLYSLADHALLRPYDEQITIYDSTEEIRLKLEQLYAEKIQDTSAGSEQQSLSAREKEIVVCVVKGLTNRLIAERLYLSAHTVITHRRNIARKLQIHSPSGLTVYAIVNKLVELSEIGKNE